MNKLEMALGYPIFLIGAMVDAIKKRTNPSQLFFFIPGYHTGGAEQVHVDILKNFTAERPWVITMHRSSNNYHKEAIKKCAELIEIGHYYNDQDRFFVKYFFYGYFTSLIKRHPQAVLLSSNCSFMYDLSANLKTGYKIDLIHGFSGLDPNKLLKPLQALDRRITVSNAVRKKLISYYQSQNVPEVYKNRIKVIYNAVPIPDRMPDKSFECTLNVVFVGRNSHEKRYHLYEQMALESQNRNLALKFFSIGGFSTTPTICSLGEILNRNDVYKALQGFHILVLCSNSEGLPLVILEAMACGLVPVSTDVGGVSEMFVDGQSGHLVKAEAEDQIVNEFMDILSAYTANNDLLKGHAEAAYRHVKKYFGYDTFSREYLKLIAEARSELANR
jgi:glycosyltransferase involved in cell wall biosynthesis